MEEACERAEESQVLNLAMSNETIIIFTFGRGSQSWFGFLWEACRYSYQPKTEKCEIHGHLSGMCTWNLKANISFLVLLPKLDRNPDFKLNLIRENGIGIETVLLARRGRRTMTIWRSVILRHFCLKENSWKELVVKVSTIIEKNGRISYFLNWVDEEETFGDLNICRTDCKDGRLNCMWKLCLDTNM